MELKPCPYTAGDVVVYAPTREVRDKLVMTGYAKLMPGMPYKIASVEEGGFVVVSGFENESPWGLYWDSFSPPPVRPTDKNRCIFRKGDLVLFLPSPGGTDAAQAAGLSGLVQKTQQYRISSVRDELFVIPEGYGGTRGVYWTEFGYANGVGKPPPLPSKFSSIRE
jgi:hypothetical protein